MKKNKMNKYLIPLLFLGLMTGQIKADPYPKNPNIDIVHYQFAIELSDDNDVIIGKTRVTALFKTSGTLNLRLDLAGQKSNDHGKGMKVSRITSSNEEIDFSQSDDVLLIHLTSASLANEERSFTIHYSGIPAGGLVIGPNKYGDRTFFSDNWPNKARQWLPTVDHPYDKATSEMIITAPDHYQVISNGLLAEESKLDDGLKKTHWKQSVPIATWLYVLGVAEFAIQYLDPFEGKSIQTWVYKQDRDAGFYDFAVPTKHALEYFSDYVGPFVYEKLANIQSNSVGGGMEAASAVFYGDQSVTGKRITRWRNVIIHEIAHQWFGNAVTEYDWDDVWLSEGFATYFTLMFREHAYGRDDFVRGLLDARKRVYDFYSKNKDYRIVHDNLSDMRNVTTGQTYQKGAWVLHMLRDLVGDRPFQDGIRRYYSRYINANAATADFKREMEASSGKDLDAFFDQWLYQGGQIVLDGSWMYDHTNKEVVISLSQVQDDGYLFSFPIEFGTYTDQSTLPDIHRFDMSGKEGGFRFHSDNRPEKVVIDPRTVLLAEWTFEEKTIADK